MSRRNPFYLIKNINDKFEAKGNIECQKAGLTFSQFRILVYLTEHSDRIVTQKEIEIEFKVSHPTINGILTRMEEKGLVSTNIIKEGKRHRQVFLLEKGKDALKEMNNSRQADDAALENLFTPTELAQFEDYLCRILDYISK